VRGALGDDDLTIGREGIQMHGQRGDAERATRGALECGQRRRIGRGANVQRLIAPAAQQAGFAQTERGVEEQGGAGGSVEAVVKEDKAVVEQGKGALPSFPRKREPSSLVRLAGFPLARE